MAWLTPEQRDVLFFRFSEGWSIERTAVLMGKTPGAIKALQFRALQALARKLR
jgi:RNA polymerase sigma-70 factor (ECF subfamily)